MSGRPLINFDPNQILRLLSVFTSIRNGILCVSTEVYFQSGLLLNPGSRTPGTLLGNGVCRRVESPGRFMHLVNLP